MNLLRFGSRLALALVVASTALRAADLEIPRCDGVCQLSGGSLRIALAIGDTARIRWSDSRSWKGPEGDVHVSGRTALVVPTRAGRRKYTLETFTGRNRIEIEIGSYRRESLALVLRPVGEFPAPRRWNLAAVQMEVRRLYRRTGLDISLEDGIPIAHPRALWDRNHNGKLELWRNDDAGRTSDEGEALVGSLENRGMEFPEIALFQDPVVVGWTLAEPALREDSLLQLAGHEALAWREKDGTTLRYVLQGPHGEDPDTFVVAGYPRQAMRAKFTGSRTGWSADHPVGHLVTKSGGERAAFGFVSLEHPDSPPILLLPSESETLRDARVLAHELGHALGLEDTAAGDNLMSAVMRLDELDPVLTMDQVMDLHEWLTPTDPSGSSK